MTGSDGVQQSEPSRATRCPIHAVARASRLDHKSPGTLAAVPCSVSAGRASARWQGTVEEDRKSGL